MWTPSQVRALASSPEGKRLEKKRGLPLEAKLARTLAAFANTRGGILVLGVDERLGIVGAPHPPECIERLRDVALRRVDPPIDVRTGVAVVDAMPVVWCSVPLSPRRPHAALRDDDTRELVVRDGSSNRAATPAALARISAELALAGDLEPFHREILAWLAERAREGRPAARPAEFAAERDAGLSRTRAAFERLERAGLLVAHGPGDAREFALSGST